MNRPAGLAVPSALNDQVSDDDGLLPGSVSSSVAVSVTPNDAFRPESGVIVVIVGRSKDSVAEPEPTRSASVAEVQAREERTTRETDFMEQIFLAKR